MKIFIVGDYYSGTGPANATAALLKSFPSKTEYFRFKNKLVRLIELVVKLPFCDAMVLSGHSKQNVIALKLAKLLKKPNVFIMHGCVEYENEINGVPNEKMNVVERKVLALCDRIVAVSIQFEIWLKHRYPQYADKICHVTNGISWEEQGSEHVVRVSRAAEYAKDPIRIISIGGGMPRKRIVKICEAIEILKERGRDAVLVVAGADGLDTEKINAYPFVKNIGLVGQGVLRERLEHSQLFIQNSCFETFGLAPLEALLAGCDVLVSANVGALSVFNRGIVKNADVIMDCENPAEIADKILAVTREPNHDRLLNGINKDETSWKKRARELTLMLIKMIQKKRKDGQG